MKDGKIAKMLGRLVGSFLGVGFLPFAPGSWASLLSLLIIFPLYDQPLWVYLVFFIIGLIGGHCSYQSWVNQSTDHDPKSFVIDEVLGMWVACFPIAMVSPATMDKKVLLSVLALLLFRFFDIYKMGGVKMLDQNYPNVYGVIGDDLLAGLQSAFIIFVYTFISSVVG